MLNHSIDFIRSSWLCRTRCLDYANSLTVTEKQGAGALELFGLLVWAALFAGIPSFVEGGEGSADGPPSTSAVVDKDAGAANPLEAKLKVLLDEVWEFRMKNSPLFATYCGDHRFDDQLDQVGLAAAEARGSAEKEFLARANELRQQEGDSTHAFSRSRKIDLEMLALDLENSLQELSFHAHLIPITNREGFHTEFPRLAQEFSFMRAKDYENYIARLKGFAKYADGHIELLRQGIREGMVLPDVSVTGIEDVLAPFALGDPEKSLLFEPFARMPTSVDLAQQASLALAGKEAIAASVRPGYAAFRDFMVQEYLPKTRGQIGASALPKGRDFYRYRVRKFTTLDVTPEHVHEVGLNEVKRIRAEMAKVVESAGFKGSVEHYRDALRADARSYAASAEQLMQITSTILKRIDGELPKLFMTLPRTPYGLRPIPDFIAPKTTSAYYSPPSGDGKRAGFYYLNTYDLKSRPLYQLEALSLHEAVPGHHLQLALQQEMPLEPHRRFSDVTAFIEGWGLYSERLGVEVGFYKELSSDFGRLSFESWRACRLVVDTGIHYLGWTRQQAIDYILQNTALSTHDATAEVDRYIAWPGQALAYKMGELHIRKLRQMAEDRLKDKFDVREFHEVVLKNGAIPLSLLTEEVEAWLAEKLGS